MNPIVLGIAAIASLFVIDAKVKPLGLAKFNPLGSGTPIIPPATNEGPKATAPNPATVPTAPVPSVIPSIIPGVPVIDGHGTGVIPGAGPIPSAPSGDPILDAARQAANKLQMDMVNALNTPATDRTPEQLALLQMAGSLPTV